MKNNNCICQAPYLRNSIAYDHYFCYTCVKWWYLQLLFSLFFFLILIFQAVRWRWKGKKWPKMKNNYICLAPYLRNSIAFDHDLWYTIVTWWYLQVFFFIFSKFWFYWLLEKMAKIAQNEKQQLHLLHNTSKVQYSIWSWFLVHFCKMISPGIFYQFFKILIFWVVAVVKGGKRGAFPYAPHYGKPWQLLCLNFLPQ